MQSSSSLSVCAGGRENVYFTSSNNRFDVLVGQQLTNNRFVTGWTTSVNVDASETDLAASFTHSAAVFVLSPTGA